MTHNISAICLSSLRGLSVYEQEFYFLSSMWELKQEFSHKVERGRLIDLAKISEEDWFSRNFRGHNTNNRDRQKMRATKQAATWKNCTARHDGQSGWPGPGHQIVMQGMTASRSKLRGKARLPAEKIEQWGKSKLYNKTVKRLTCPPLMQTK